MVLIAMIVVLLLFKVSKLRCYSLVGEAICRVETSAPVVALSFDDGPSNVGVDAALAALASFDVHASFFLFGSEVAPRPELVRRLVSAGNEVGNHGYSHVWMIGRSRRFHDQEIERTDAILRAAGVADPRLFRPPYGKKLVGLPMALERHGYRMILWDVADLNSAATPRDYARQIVDRARPGSIILMHVMSSSNGTAREALPLVLAGLAKRGLRVVTVGELLAGRQPTGNRPAKE
jgi:peptidoglycan/xylan/chitin deacetylase (PgdA/CDA1 family)